MGVLSIGLDVSKYYPSGFPDTKSKPKLRSFFVFGVGRNDDDSVIKKTLKKRTLPRSI